MKTTHHPDLTHEHGSSRRKEAQYSPAGDQSLLTSAATIHGRKERERLRGFTLLEILLVVTVIVILAALWLPVAGRAKAKAKQTQCLSQLKQAGLAFQSFAHDHADQFPALVSTNNGGSLEFVQAGNALGGNFYFAYRHLQALSNELGEPKLLVCPADNRTPAASFSSLKNDNVSYFVGVTADYSKPDSILAGDRNIANASFGAAAIVRVGSNDVMEWTAKLHEYRGNLLFADGRVELLNNAGLLSAIGHSPIKQSAFLTPLPAPRNPSPGGDVVGGAGKVNSANSAVARLEEVLTNQPSTPPPSDRTTARVHPNGVLPEESTPQEASSKLIHTNPPAQISANTRPNPVEAEISAGNRDPVGIARVLGSWGSRLTYLFLFIILAIFLTLEVHRRRRAKKKGAR